MYKEDKYRKYEQPGTEEIEFKEETALDKVMSILGKAKEIAGPKAEETLPIIKKYWWIVPVLLVVLIILFFLADFFIFSVKTVEVRIGDTEGALIPDATIKIYESDGKTEKAKFSGSQTLQLRTGEYPIKVSAVGYKVSAANSITVTEEGTIVVTLEKDMDIDLELVEDFPTQLLTGEERSVTLSITNNGTEPASLELVFEQGFGSKYMGAEYTKPITVSPGTVEATLTLKFKKDAPEKENLEGIIRVKYLSEKIEARFDLLKFDEKKVETSPRSLSFGRIAPGDVGRKTVEIENKNDFDMTAIQLEADIDSTEYTDEEVVEGWFHFSPSATVDVGAGQEERITVEVKPLLTDVRNVPEGEEETIGGNLVIKTTYWSKNIRVEFKVKPTTVRLEVEGLDSKYTISYDEGTNDYESRTDTITLKNKGEVSIENIDILPLPEKGNFCGTTTEWIQLNKTHIDEIGTARGENEEDIIIIIDVPSTKQRGETTICEFRVRYNDPLVMGGRETSPGCCQFIIETR